MGGKPSPPTPPNPMKVAAAQTESNVETAMANATLNNINTYGPTGSTEFKHTGQVDIVEIQLPNGRTKHIEVPRWESHQELSKDQQRLLDLQEETGTNLGRMAVQTSDRLKDHLGNGINTDRLPDQVRRAPNAPELNVAGHITPGYRDEITRGQIQGQIGANDFSADRRRVEEALMSRLEPQIERDRAALQSRLANQGITHGSEAWNRALDQQGRNVNDLRMQVIGAGGAEQSRLFGMDATKGQFANQAQAQGFTQSAAQNQFFNQTQQQRASDELRRAEHANQVRLSGFGAQSEQSRMQNTLRQQALQEQVALRNQPLSEISQLLHGSAPTMPHFQGWTPATIANTPVGQYHYQSAALEQQNYMAEMQQQQAMMGGLFGLGSMGLYGMFRSDRRTKENIKKVGALDNGIPLYLYNYIGETEPRIGPMADEVEKVKPWAVAEIGGIKHISYGLAVEA